MMTQADELISAFEAAAAHPVLPAKPETALCRTGIDLGTACVVLAVLDEDNRPVGGAWRYADVVRDGMVVDYLGAVAIVRELKELVEADLGGVELVHAAAAIPPGTDSLDGGAVRHVAESAGFTLDALADESTAANEVLGIRDGAVVDIGGGTTGISIFQDGQVRYTADEPTGGTHFSLVLAGAKQMTFEDAEVYKRDPAHHAEILPVLKPTIEKVASIIARHIVGYRVPDIYLVGGTACLTGIEQVVEAALGIPTHKPANPMFVTPLGIAMTCCKAEKER